MVTRSESDAEIEIARYVLAILGVWKRIGLVSLVVGLSAAAFAATRTDSYQANCLVDVREAVDAGGVNPGSFRYREALAVIETGFVLDANSDNQRQVVTAELESRALAAAFASQEEVLREILADRWLSAEQRWDEEEGRPTPNEAARLLLKEYLTVELDPETQIISVYMKARTPELAAAWSNGLVAMFNERERQKAIARSDRRIQALIERLAETQIVELERAIYRIIEAETQVGLLARADTEYAVEVVDAAVAPKGPVGASPRRYGVVGAVVGMLVCVSCVAGREVVAQVTSWLDGARRHLA